MFRAIAPILFLSVLTACNLVPDVGGRSSQAASRQATRATQPVFVGDSEARQCHAQLSQTQASFSPLPDRFYGAGCSTTGTVQLSSLRSDNASLALSNIGPVACPLANTFAAWARFGVDRAARQILGSPLVRIETMGSYSCRNVSGSTRRSAHATANAIDVAAFVLADGRRISVSDDWSEGSSSEREFLRIIHRSACKRFGIVLGPEYNAAHRDHFHLEAGESDFCR